MINLIIVLVALLLGGYLAFSRRLAGSSNWQATVTALANTGDDMKPEDWVAFYCDGSFGVCIHAGI